MLVYRVAGSVLTSRICCPQAAQTGGLSGTRVEELGCCGSGMAVGRQRDQSLSYRRLDPLPAMCNS